MTVNLKINISIQGESISTSLILGPAPTPEDQKSSPEELIKRLEWPYNYSNDGALLPSYTPSAELVSLTT